MDGSSSPDIVERSGDGWSYSLDATHAPDYVLLTGVGTPSAASLKQGAADLIAMMESIVGRGRRFCPLIFDIRQGVPGNLSIPELMQASSGITLRLGYLILLVDPEMEKREALLAYLKTFSSFVPDFDVVHSLDEALSKLRPQG